MNCKKALSILSMFVLLLWSSHALATEKNSILWEISGNGLKKSSYLLGTHHLVSTDFLENVKGLHDAWEATEQTVGEIDLSNMSQMQMQIMMSAIMPDTVSYHSLMSEQDVALLNKTLTELTGMGLDQLGSMKPAMLQNLITITLYQQYYPELSQTVSIDQYFQDKATKRNRPVVSLESVEDQIELLLHSQTIERQAESLACMLHHPELLKEQMDELHIAYHEQNLQKLNAIFEKTDADEPCPATQEEKDGMNKNRNEKWLQKLPQIMSEKSSFIAVGCLHLVGEHGLIAGLRKAGYTVKAVE